jgi:hypothetical protein
METDWSLIVQIGTLGCLVYIIWFLHAWDVINTRNLNKLYKYLDEIKENQE